MRFEYKRLRDPADDELNELAKEGWVVQQFAVRADGLCYILLARAVPK